MVALEYAATVRWPLELGVWYHVCYPEEYWVWQTEALVLAWGSSGYYSAIRCQADVGRRLGEGQEKAYNGCSGAENTERDAVVGAVVAGSAADGAVENIAEEVGGIVGIAAAARPAVAISAPGEPGQPGALEALEGRKKQSADLISALSADVPLVVSEDSAGWLMPVVAGGEGIVGVALLSVQGWALCLRLSILMLWWVSSAVRSRIRVVNRSSFARYADAACQAVEGLVVVVVAAVPWGVVPEAAPEMDTTPWAGHCSTGPDQGAAADSDGPESHFVEVACSDAV